MSVSHVVRYGDLVVLESCECEEHLFLGIVPRKVGRRHPLQLSTEVAEADKYPDTDYQWRLLPVAGSKRRWGDPVAYADRIRLQKIDDKGLTRMLAVSHLDDRSIMAERRPARIDSCTWWLSYSTDLSVERDGRVTPTGEFSPYLQYGDLNYLTLVNRAGYLGAMDDQYRILRKRTVLLDDLPERGKSVWWRMHRSTADVGSVVRQDPRAVLSQDMPIRSLSVA
jgi:hypothetical protein